MPLENKNALAKKNTVIFSKTTQQVLEKPYLIVDFDSIKEQYQPTSIYGRVYSDDGDSNKK